MEKENQRVRITKHLLRETLLEMLRETSIEKVSVTELCKRSGINRSTFYAHYSIPKDILLDIKRDFASHTIASLHSPGTDAGPEEQLVRICEYISANADLEKIILANSTDDEVTEAVMGCTFDLWDISSSFTRGKETDEESRRLIAVFFHYGIFRVIREWIMNDIPKSPKEIAGILSHILFDHAMLCFQKAEGTGKL